MSLRHRCIAFVAVLALTLPLSGCAVDGRSEDVSPTNPLAELSDRVKTGVDDLLADPSDSNPGNHEDADWTEAKAPNYYKVRGKADFAGLNIPEPGTIVYGTPDRLHRSGPAIGVITPTMMRQGSARERTMPDTITGWPAHNPKVAIPLDNGRTYHGHLYNKSHLIAKSLGGEDSARNMITGTRTQNVGDNDATPGGMAYAETRARDWLKRHPHGTITYAATPHYRGSELLPRTVTVDMRSSDGMLDEHVIVYNTAKGQSIDYRDGLRLQ